MNFNLSESSIDRISYFLTSAACLVTLSCVFAIADCGDGHHSVNTWHATDVACDPDTSAPCNTAERCYPLPPDAGMDAAGGPAGPNVCWSY